MKKLHLSKKDKKISGLCSGIAEYFGTDATWVRIIAVFITLVTAVIPSILTYIIAVMIIPYRPDHVVHDVK